MKINFDSNKKHNPVYEDGMKIPYAPAKRARAAWRWYIVVLITAGPLLFFLGKIILSYIYVAAPGVVSLRKIELNSPESASVKKIYIKKGDKITAGAKIAELSDPALDDQISELDAEITGLRIKISAGPTADRLRANVALAQRIMDSRTVYLGQVKYLFAKGAATAAELNLATSQHNQAQLELSRARADLAASGAVKSVDYAQSRRQGINKDIETLGRKKTRLEIRTPVSGVVSELLVSENQSVSKGAQLAKINIPEEYSLRAYVEPSEINHARKGKKVTIRMPGRYLLTGYITSDPDMAKTMPSELLNPFSESRERIEVDIKPSYTLPGKYRIDGLPVKVYFGFPGF